jgi:hypothetical protein
MSYDLLSESWPVARKVHRCIWCGEPIEIGTKYRAECSVFDGEIQNHHWHEECNADAIENMDGSEREFMAYDNPRPEVVRKLKGETK